MNEIKKILSNYTKDDYQLFYNTVDELCRNGISCGCYQNYAVLIDVISILSICENIIKGELV